LKKHNDLSNKPQVNQWFFVKQKPVSELGCGIIKRMFLSNGFGPENMFLENNVPDGQFKVDVDDYEYISQGADFFI
jgi:hypothetical protein